MSIEKREKLMDDSQRQSSDAEFEVSDKGARPNRVWYKLTKYVKPQKEAKTDGN